MLVSHAEQLQSADDRHWLLAYAMLHSLAQDLAKLRAAGLWVRHPEEMRLSEWYHHPCAAIMATQRLGASEWTDTPKMILEQYNTLTPKLCDLITTETQARIRMAPSTVLRLALTL